MVLEGEQVEKPSAAEETCLRGFSFMPETKVEMNLQVKVLHYFQSSSSVNNICLHNYLECLNLRPVLAVPFPLQEQHSVSQHTYFNLPLKTSVA